MISTIEYLDIPTVIGAIIVGVFFVMQIIGEILEFNGKIVPEIFKVRKCFIRRKQERDILHKLPETLKEMQNSLDEFNSHYSADNINMRNKWIQNVNIQLEHIKELDKKLDRNNEDTLSLLIDSKRKAIIDFASYVIDEKNLVTREQFNRIFKIYDEYEIIIKQNSLKNGEVDIAIRIIREEYKKHMREHSFIEDVRGYNI